jgi:lipoprotein-anchoring transpeptidase ErfK/SrfK
MSSSARAEGGSLLRYRLGFLGAWALFVIAAGLFGVATAAEVENVRDARWLSRLERIDRMIGERLSGKVDELRGTAEEHDAHVAALRSRVAKSEVRLDEPADSPQVITVSTAENRVYVRRGGKVVFTAVCSTGKGTKLVVENGRQLLFETPTGRFRIVSKEENPTWVPPDWHYVEEARKKNLRTVRLQPGDAIDAETGNVVPAEPPGGIWSSLSGSGSRRRVLRVEKNTVVEVRPDGTRRELPPGEMIRAGNAVVIPPSSVPQRHFEKVLGHYRLNIGNGYALHGTLETRQLGRAVSHGCVRLGDADMEKLFNQARVGDEVIIY